MPSVLMSPPGSAEASDLWMHVSQPLPQGWDPLCDAVYAQSLFWEEVEAGLLLGPHSGSNALTLSLFRALPQ